VTHERFFIHTLGRLALAALVTIGALACSQEPASPRADAGADVSTHAGHEQLWTCGMHPDVIEHEPGPCPICGMALVPIHEDASAQGGGIIKIDPVVVQNMGVRIETVKRQTLFRHLRTVGEVATAEDLVSVVNPRFSGWVERVHVGTTGELIEQGEPLFDIYSPDLVAAQDEYLLALRTQGRKAGLTKSARRKLDLFGLAPADIEAIERGGRSKRAVSIRAPRSGYVLHKNIVEGARIPAGQDVYTIGDLSSVWVQAEIYEHDAPWVAEGQSARMELSYQRGVRVEGSVAYVYPTLNATSRTLTVRLEFPNPELRFKPGMFATVYIEFRRIDDAIVVPTEAVLHSGTREIVFVSVGEGRFEAREITTGLVGDRRKTQVLTGLEPGEQVVTSGQFLIDSESQLQEAIAKMRTRQAGEAAPTATPATDEIYACPMHPDEIAHAAGHCDVCGMDLELRSATDEEMARLRVREREAGGATPAHERDESAMPEASR